MTAPDPAVDRLRPHRSIKGHVALLLPHLPDGSVDWSSFESLVHRTVDAGLVPAVNMDTGFTQLLDTATRSEVLKRTTSMMGTEFLAGAYVADAPGDRFDEGEYHRALAEIAHLGATPVVFPSHGLNALSPEDWVAAHASFAQATDRFVAFELGDMFVPYGRIYPLQAYRGLLGIGACVGAKHSSLSRRAEWDRLTERDANRPEFMVLTGNDLAIDMVCWGSDYLLGLATFAPDAFAQRDAYWATGDDRFFAYNDVLQALGAFAFRDPVPAYRHDAAMFLALRRQITSDTVPPGCPRRPESDREVLRGLASRLEQLT